VVIDMRQRDETGGTGAWMLVDRVSREVLAASASGNDHFRGPAALVSLPLVGHHEATRLDRFK
jgi:hypothetical protein